MKFVEQLGGMPGWMVLLGFANWFLAGLGVSWAVFGL